jgi:hypothetical protein
MFMTRSSTRKRLRSRIVGTNIVDLEEGFRPWAARYILIIALSAHAMAGALVEFPGAPI